jgi:hypothetical protein
MAVQLEVGDASGAAGAQDVDEAGGAQMTRHHGGRAALYRVADLRLSMQRLAATLEGPIFRKQGRQAVGLPTIGQTRKCVGQMLAMHQDGSRFIRTHEGLQIASSGFMHA